MGAIVYPASLPAPSSFELHPTERRALSSLTQGPEQVRGRSTDFHATLPLGWVFDRAELAAFVAWGEVTLAKWTRWFAVTLPGRGGFVTRHCRFYAIPKWEYLGRGGTNGIWRVSEQLEQRGRGVTPQACVVVLEDAAVGWEFQSIAHHANPGTTNLTPPASGWGTGQAPFGGGEAGVFPQFPNPNSNWPIKTILWARRTVDVPPGLDDIVLYFFAENGAVIFIDGVQVGTINNSNVQGGNLPFAYRSLALSGYAGASFELGAKCFDETAPAGGTTLFICKIEDASCAETAAAPPAASSFGFTSRWTVTSPSTDAQGVATDGTSIWYSNSSELRKYDKSGTLITSRAVAGDTPTDKQQINGMFYKDGVLYVSAAKFVGGVGTSYIVEYNPTTLAYVTHHTLTQDAFSEGCAFHAGHWWVIFHASKYVAKYDSSWTFVATYSLDFSITGSSGGYGSGQGYDGMAWDGDYLYLNIHEIYNEDFVDVYHWNGTGFDPVYRNARATSKATQGLAIDPVETDVIWWAERNYSGADGVAKGTLVR